MNILNALSKLRHEEHPNYAVYSTWKSEQNPLNVAMLVAAC
jgi:hypothetical protein